MEPYRRILCAHDYSEPAACALGSALSLATQTGAALDVLYADEIHRSPFDPHPSPESAPARLRARVTGAAIGVDVLPTGRVQIHHAATWGESAAEAIAAYAADHQVDLVVIGTHGGRGLRRLLLGSVAEDVMHHVACPVLILRAGEQLRHDGPVVVAVSFTDGCDEAIAAGKQLAQTLEASLRFVHVVPSSRIGTAEEARVRKRLQERVGAVGAGTASLLGTLHVAILYGAPGEEIAAYAGEVGARALVVGLPRGVRPLLGGTTERLLHDAPCPLLVAKARPFRAPASPATQTAAAAV